MYEYPVIGNGVATVCFLRTAIIQLQVQPGGRQPHSVEFNQRVRRSGFPLYLE
jgi:hypothetical protein